MMSLVETIRAYLGWCPMKGSMRVDRAVQLEVAAAPGGRDGALRTEPGWWNRYHNQLLVTALAFSAAAAATFILVEDTLGYPAVWTGLAIGVGGALGFLLGYRKQYARIAAGEFIRANMSRRLRIARDLSWPVALILLAVCMAYFVRSGMFGQILGFMLALSVIGWISYAVTTLWERRHRTTLIAERGSMYTLDTATEGERV
ncbi:hypothetical protein BN140_1846 [Methanoculleus bourgensis MS2]|uniref:DUF1673 family protein n=2 Tax=Methanoculleus bourgensis TaxID=83986 RepID=I7LN39_METBM|nr:hypothetical protein BN140_1846 [Methanoculleus bourgensis MS2]